MHCNIDSLYICVKNMDRAIKFYEDFLNNRLQSVMRYIVCLQ